MAGTDGSVYPDERIVTVVPMVSPDPGPTGPFGAFDEQATKKEMATAMPIARPLDSFMESLLL
jgi:hypothetical protein